MMVQGQVDERREEAMSAELRTEMRKLQDALDDLGGVSPARILAAPPPGLASEHDVIRLNGRKRELCELVDGFLVSKAMGFREALIAMTLGAMLRRFVRAGRLGVVTGADGAFRLAPGLVRMPDVAFTSWANIPEGRVPTEKVVAFSPDLAIEVLSASNTPGEMIRKRSEYFDAGVGSFWIVDPEARTIAVFDHGDAETPRLFQESDVIEMTEILPGFRLSLAELFGELDEEAPEAP